MREAAEAASKWWRERIWGKATLMSDEIASDYGEASNLMLNGMTSVLRGRFMAQSTPSRVDAFEKGLADAIENELNGERHFKQAWANTDYHPCGNLRKALDAAGFVNYDFGLPCKVCVRIQPDSVAVSDGYAAPFETIWSASDEVTE